MRHMHIETLDFDARRTSAHCFDAVGLPRPTGRSFKAKIRPLERPRARKRRERVFSAKVSARPVDLDPAYRRKRVVTRLETDSGPLPLRNDGEHSSSVHF